MMQQPHVLAQSTLGINGRFGNQIFQYAFQRILAKQMEMDLQTPAWIGQYLFGHCDPLLNGRLPMCIEGRDFAEAVFPAELFAQTPRSFDLFGYFQFHTSHYAPYRDFFRSLFRPVPQIEEPLQHAVDQLKQSGGTLVGLHLRRGDFGVGPYFRAPCEWYVQFLREVWPTLTDPILFIASDEPAKVIEDFTEFEPITSAELGLHLFEAPFYSDFYLLTQCDVLAISNSTYSFAASMLNQSAHEFHRPDLNLKSLIRFDPWDSLPILHRELAKPLSESIAEMERGARQKGVD